MSLDPLVNASVGFSMTIQQQLATTAAIRRRSPLPQRRLFMRMRKRPNRCCENTSLLPAEAHTARCTTGTVGSTGAAEENGIVLFPGTGGGTGPKQQ
jgi:hypothetical protein